MHATASSVITVNATEFSVNRLGTTYSATIHIMEKPDDLRPHDTIRSQLRLPAVLHEQLKSACEATGRSMNAEIVHRLEKSMELSQVVGAATGLADGALESVGMAKIWTRMLQKGIDQDEAAAQTAEAMKEMREQILLLRQVVEDLAKPDSTNKKPRK